MGNKTKGKDEETTSKVAQKVVKPKKKTKSK
jgi:hypothetical protein